MHAFAASLGAAILVAAAIMPAQAAGQSADARFIALYTKEWAWRVEQFGQQDNRSVDTHLPGVDPDAQAAREMIIERRDRLAEEWIVVGQPAVPAREPPSPDLEVEPALGLLAPVERPREPPPDAGRGMPLANVGDSHRRGV